MTGELNVHPEHEELWRSVLTGGHRSRYSFLPSPPRCIGCMEPLAGVGGRMLRVIGHRASRKNPNLCNLCDDGLPTGGAEVDIAVLFADVRESTPLAERLGPKAFAETMNRFYHLATNILVNRNAMIDKMVGDEVMALFIPAVCRGEHRRLAVESALELSEAIAGPGTAGEALPVGIGVNAGPAFVGKFGRSDVHDFTALGDTVNTGARLQSEARAGQIAVSEELYEAFTDRLRGAVQHEVQLKGKSEASTIWVWQADGSS
ncbi:MAG TPA: adenylate/guanylate cyclase domain-containing protein [Dehalococcoidia bacterium]